MSYGIRVRHKKNINYFLSSWLELRAELTPIQTRLILLPSQINSSQIRLRPRWTTNPNFFVLPYKSPLQNFFLWPIQLQFNLPEHYYFLLGIFNCPPLGLWTNVSIGGWIPCTLIQLMECQTIFCTSVLLSILICNFVSAHEIYKIWHI
jgi:hypothetical protein